MHSAWLLVMTVWALPVAAQGRGTIVGRVRLAGPGSGGSEGGGGGGGLANVLVWVSDGLSAGAKYQAPRAPVVVTIAASRFQPVVVALLAGQPLELRNTDATPRRVRGSPAGGRPFTVEVSPSGGTARRYFSATAAPMRIEMASDPGGVAWVAVLRHPFFAVTGPDGRYALRGLPPGTYTVAAWHPRAGTLAATVTVSGGDARAPDFRFAAP